METESVETTANTTNAVSRQAFSVVNGQTSSVERSVVEEYPVTIFLNNWKMATLLGSPGTVEDLAVGFLASEGFLSRKDEIKKLTIDRQKGIVSLEIEALEALPAASFGRLIGSGCGRGVASFDRLDRSLKPVLARVRVTLHELLAMVDTFEHFSATYKATHGLHGAALCRDGKIEVFCEDIGRHNAVDRVFGRAILEGVSTPGPVLITSGRVCSEVAYKAVRNGMPVLVSLASPTNLAIDIAAELGLTLVTSVRGGKMDIFSHAERIT